MSSSTNRPEQKYQSVHTGSLAEEFAKNDDIVDYIQDTSLEKLRAKYGAAEEDSRIRNNDFNPNEFSSFHTSPVSSKPVRHDVLDTPVTTSDIKLKFETATSRYDNDKVLFSDIKLEEKKEEPTKKKRGRPPKVKVDEVTPAELPKKRGRPPKAQPVEQPANSITEKFNTNTRVIFVDNSIADGIKRTDDFEVSSAFINEKPKKRKGIFRR